jgi:hypothetical protein
VDLADDLLVASDDLVGTDVGGWGEARQEGRRQQGGVDGAKADVVDTSSRMT